jgi:hypothetical protein
MVIRPREQDNAGRKILAMKRTTIWLPILAGTVSPFAVSGLGSDSDGR